MKISVSELKRQAILKTVMVEQEEGLSWEEISRRVSEKGRKGKVASSERGGEDSCENKLANEEDLPGESRDDIGGEENAEEIEIPRPAFLQEEKELSGAARGTLYHMVMEHFPYGKIRESGREWSAADFDGYLEEMIAGGYMTAQEREVLDSDKFVAFLASDIGQRMAEAHCGGKKKEEREGGREGRREGRRQVAR